MMRNLSRAFWVLLGMATVFVGIPMMRALKLPLDAHNQILHLAMPFVGVGLWFLARGTETFYHKMSPIGGVGLVSKSFGAMILLCGISQIVIESAWLYLRRPVTMDHASIALFFGVIAIPMIGEGFTMMLGPRKGLFSEIEVGNS